MPQPRIGMRSHLPHAIQLIAVPGENFTDVIRAIEYAGGKIVLRKARLTVSGGLITNVDTKPKKMGNDEFIKLLLNKCLQLAGVDQAGIRHRIWSLRVLTSEGREVAVECLEYIQSLDLIAMDGRSYPNNQVLWSKTMPAHAPRALRYGGRYKF